MTDGSEDDFAPYLCQKEALWVINNGAKIGYKISNST